MLAARSMSNGQVPLRVRKATGGAAGPSCFGGQNHSPAKNKVCSGDGCIHECAALDPHLGSGVIRDPGAGWLPLPFSTLCTCMHADQSSCSLSAVAPIQPLMNVTGCVTLFYQGLRLPSQTAMLPMPVVKTAAPARKSMSGAQSKAAAPKPVAAAPKPTRMVVDTVRSVTH